MDDFKYFADSLKEDFKAKQKEQKVITKYGELFHPKNIDNLTAEDFKSFLSFKNNHHWKGIARSNNLITSDMARLREALKILLDESRPLERRLDIWFPPNKPSYIKRMGKATATPILLVVYPDKYGVWNELGQQVLMRHNLLSQFSRGASFSDKYMKINKVLNDLASQYDLSLWQVDRVLWDIADSGC